MPIRPWLSLPSVRMLAVPPAAGARNRRLTGELYWYRKMPLLSLPVVWMSVVPYMTASPAPSM